MLGHTMELQYELTSPKDCLAVAKALISAVNLIFLCRRAKKDKSAPIHSPASFLNVFGKPPARVTLTVFPPMAKLDSSHMDDYRHVKK